MKTELNPAEIEQQICGDIQACNSLLELLDQEQEALKSRDAEALASVIDLKTQPLTHLETSAKQRAHWLNIGDPAEMSKQWKILLDDLAHDKIKRDWETLKQLTRECRQKNEINGKFLSRHQQIYGRLMELVRGQTAAPNLYTSNGAASTNQYSNKMGEA